MNTIEFNGNKYPSEIVNLPFGNVTISNSALNESLMNRDGSYISEEARIIDEEIFYLVDEEILCYRKNEISEFILSEIC